MSLIFISVLQKMEKFLGLVYSPFTHSFFWKIVSYNFLQLV